MKEISLLKDLFGKCDQIYSFLRIWSNLLKKSLMENFNFRPMFSMHYIQDWSQEVPRVRSPHSKNIFWGACGTLLCSIGMWSIAMHKMPSKEDTIVLLKLTI